MIVALITAGGVGKRFKSSIPKQFLCVNDKPILAYTLEKMEANKNIDKIIVACLDGWEDYLYELKEKYNITKLTWLAKNGQTQPESIKNCVDILKNKIKNDDIVLIHAGNRPLVSNSVINESIEICKKLGNAVAAIKCPEVIVDTSNNEIINRNHVLRVQTPQVFKFSDLKEYYSHLSDYDDVATTCDLAIRLGYKINFINGSFNNLKITYKDDLHIFKALLGVDDD